VISETAIIDAQARYQCLGTGHHKFAEVEVLAVAHLAEEVPVHVICGEGTGVATFTLPIGRTDAGRFECCEGVLDHQGHAGVAD